MSMIVPISIARVPSRKVVTDPPARQFHMDCGILGAAAIYPLRGQHVICVRIGPSAAMTWRVK